MYGVELFPTLAHCIETVAREEFWNLVNKYMESEDEELQSNIELLKAFLESMDFKKLRSESERYLIQGKIVQFTINWKDNKPSYEMVVAEGGNAKS